MTGATPPQAAEAAAAPPPADTSPGRAGWRAWALRRRYLLALLAYAALAATFTHDWDGFVFERATRDLWEGRTPYEVAEERPWFSLLGPADTEPQWYAYPPLPILLQALTFAPAILLDLPEPAQRLLLKLPVIAGTMLLAWVAGAWAAHLGRDARTRTHVEAAFLANPFLVLVGPVWGMTDTLLMAAFLGAALAFERHRALLAGLALAAALLTKPFAALLALPLLARALAQGRHRETLLACGAAALACAAVVLPFVLRDPGAFWQHAIGMHLGRATQGLSLWALPPLSLLPQSAVRAASMLLLGAGLALVAAWAPDASGRQAPLRVTLAAAAVVLAANRVVNEQYLVLAMAPLGILLLADPGHRALGIPPERAPAAWRAASRFLAAVVVLTGFHFLTFVPPDIAMPVFGRPVDEVAHILRTAAPWLWATVAWTFAIAVPLLLLAAAWQSLRGLKQRAWPPSRVRWPAVAAVLLLAIGGLAPASSHATHAAEPSPPQAGTPAVAAFYYLWWNNPAHDPEALYGNWLRVSQSPEIGYYTQNRGIARDHARQMVEHGIDTAIVSFHRGEELRYQVFQEEAGKAGLKVAPLIEINQVYDKVRNGELVHRPRHEDGRSATYAAYRLSQGVENEIVAFVLDLREQIQGEANLRIDGRPVVLFYDAYVSGVSFHGEDRDRLAQAVVDLFPIDDLRRLYNDTTLQPDAVDMLRYHPTTYREFFTGGRAAPWRAAHLHLHMQFWERIRDRLEAELGPLHLIAGDAYNEQAGFEAGTVKSLEGLRVFDGSFIYSPSFTWGTNKEKPYETVYASWEDRNHWMQAFSRGRARTSVVGLAPTYDDTVNRPVHGFIVPASHDGVATWDRSWDSMAWSPPTIVAISTWNEFFEGSSIEPSVEHGDSWLRSTPQKRAQLLAAREQSVPPVAFVVHERSSRTHWEYSEMDEPHAWGVRLVHLGVLPVGPAA
ncbi:MAG TPA: hypothetical protein VFH47_07320, partial [Candidatus Thermoplasmatota archaeon]|nr:hypothetical protein [Candidatus Thermoplasmatota archaeon]